MAKDDGSNDLSRQERNFASQVRTLREERGWSQNELAERMRRFDLPYVNQTAVSRIENLTRPVRLMEAQALSVIFGRTTYAMTNPDSSEVFLHLIEGNQRAGRRSYVQFKDAVRTFAAAQASAENDLETLRTMFGAREDLDPESEGVYRQLVQNVEQFTKIRLLDEAADIVKSARKANNG